MTDTPQVLLAHHLKTLKLPTFLREYNKLARQCAAEGADHVRYLHLYIRAPIPFCWQSQQNGPIRLQRQAQSEKFWVVTNGKFTVVTNKVMQGRPRADMKMPAAAMPGRAGWLRKSIPRSRRLATMDCGRQSRYNHF